MKRLSCVAVALLTIVILGGYAQGQGQKWVEAEGMAQIENNDVGKAYDKALEDARRKAVEHVVGTMVDSETLVENFTTVSDKIYSQSAGFICGDQVLSKSTDQYGTYHVKIRACVELGKVEDNLLAIGICLRRMENPRTMLMIAEQNVGQKIHGWWQGSDLSLVEQKLMEAFGNKGFRLIDPSIASGNIKAVKAIAGAPDPNDAIRAGKAYNAEFVVIGKALVTCKPKDSYGFYNCYANVTTRIVKVDTGDIVGSAAARARQAHIEEHESGARALAKAGDEVAPKLIKALTQRCGKETTGGNEYKVMLSNVSSFTKLSAFIKAVQQIRGVKSVSRRSFRRPRAEIEIMYTGRAGDLAGELESKAGVTITDVTANTIKAQLQ